MIIFKKKGFKFNQDIYDYFFQCIENNIRELGYGDVSVNKKMKEFNKILYDILLKIEDKKLQKSDFIMNALIIDKYFEINSENNDLIYKKFDDYFNNFYTFCFELPINNMLNNLNNFKYSYGST